QGSNGRAVLLADQDRSLWDAAHIRRGLAALDSAQKLGGGAGYYALQAATAACHMRAPSPEQTSSERIVLLYDALMKVAPSPVVALNRAVAVGMSQGPAAGLAAVDAMAGPAEESPLAGYHLMHSVRGDLLRRMGRVDEAREAIRQAIALTQNLRERELLEER